MPKKSQLKPPAAIPPWTFAHYRDCVGCEILAAIVSYFFSPQKFPHEILCDSQNLQDMAVFHTYFDGDDSPLCFQKANWVKFLNISPFGVADLARFEGLLASHLQTNNLIIDRVSYLFSYGLTIEKKKYKPFLTEMAENYAAEVHD